MDDAKQGFNELQHQVAKGLSQGNEQPKKITPISWFVSHSQLHRSSIYSTNLIESFNKKLKRQTKKKEQFPNESALERVLVTVISGL